MKMAYGFFNMFTINVLLILILLSIVNVDGLPFMEKMYDYFCDRNTSMPTTRLDGKTAIITGSNSEIGEATALELYKRGARVIMLCRNDEAAFKAIARINTKTTLEFNKTLKEPPFGKLEHRHLDLSNLDNVRTSARPLLELEPKIDILVNYAGVFTSDKICSENGHKIHLAINHLGPFLFTLLLLPKIQESESARIINVISEAYKWSDKTMQLNDISLEETNYHSLQSFDRSQLDNLLFTTELAKRLNAVKDNRVTVLAVYPGITYTNIANDLKSYKIFYDAYEKLIQLKPELAAQSIVYCLLDSECGKHSGSFYSKCKIKEPDSKVINEITSKKLWESSCKLVKLNDHENPFKDSCDTVQLPKQEIHVNSSLSNSTSYYSDSEDDFRTPLLGITLVQP